MFVLMCDNSWAEISAQARATWASLHWSPTRKNIEKAFGSQICYHNAQCFLCYHVSATEAEEMTGNGLK